MAESLSGLWLVVMWPPLDDPIRVAIQSLVIGLVITALPFVRMAVKERIGAGDPPYGSRTPG